MGLLDFLNTPQGVGLLSAAAGAMAGARRGQPWNTAGRGAVAGLAGYAQANEQRQMAAQQQIDNQDREAQRALRQQQIDIQRQKAEADRAEDDVALGSFRTMFADAGYDPETGGFLPVSTDSEMQTLPMGGEQMLSGEDFQKPKAPNPMESVFGELGWTLGRQKFFQSQLKADPKAAMKNLERAYIEADRVARGGKKEARDVIAKERALAEAMGIPLQQYLREKSAKSGVNVTVPVYNYGQPRDVTLPTGEEALVRFDNKNPHAPPVVMEGYKPTSSDTQHMTAGYAGRMANAEKIFDELEASPKKGYAGWGSRVAGGLGDDARNIVMSPEQQKRRQAEDDWIRSKLRKESGAVIAADEMESERRTYFPYPGDSDAVIKQKAQARKQAVEAMRKTAGPALPSKPAAKPAQTQQPARKYNPATGRIE